MVRILNRASAVLLGLLPVVGAQNASGPGPSAPLWTQAIGQVDKGNGAFLSPNGRLLVVVSSDATVRSFDPLTGDPGWMFAPPSPELSSSFGGAFFCNHLGESYILISVVTNAIYADLAKRYRLLDQLNFISLFDASARFVC
jgi:hypothetical protein